MEELYKISKTNQLLRRRKPLICLILLVISGCAPNNDEGLIKKWYVKGIIDLKTGRKTLMIQKCEYMELRNDFTYEDRPGHLGKWRIENDSLVLVPPSGVDTMKFKIHEVSSDNLTLITKIDGSDHSIAFIERPELCDWVEVK